MARERVTTGAILVVLVVLVGVGDYLLSDTYSKMLMMLTGNSLCRVVNFLGTCTRFYEALFPESCVQERWVDRDPNSPNILANVEEVDEALDSLVKRSRFRSGVKQTGGIEARHRTVEGPTGGRIPTPPKVSPPPDDAFKYTTSPEHPDPRVGISKAPMMAKIPESSVVGAGNLRGKEKVDKWYFYGHQFELLKRERAKFEKLKGKENARQKVLEEKNVKLSLQLKEPEKKTFFTARMTWEQS
ncbi:hypothetical protein L1987_45539 [Smallanthus sonchifolius]|uniref:Uncharacterized protein n=1 Tax=Smallanthus sonchifolius TaxID=185202 RepID=A0ACB9FXC5_9ASTR|nr:hypothetical protein L1987_45539 [Smallanthus sonchifolius]